MRLLAACISALAFLTGCQILSGLNDYDVSEIGTGGNDAGVCDPLATNDVAPGQPLWVHQLGDSAAQTAFAVAVDPTGDIVVAGEMAGSLSIGSQTLITFQNSIDGFILKLDACGGLRWAKTFAGPGYQGVRAVAISPQGDIVVAGVFGDTLSVDGATETSAGGADIFVSKLDAAGGLTWLKRFGGPGEDIANDVAFHPTNDAFAVGGNFQGVVEFGPVTLTSLTNVDAMVTVMDGAGNVITAGSFGGPDHDTVGALAFDPQGALHVAANTSGLAINFGNGPLPVGGYGDFGLATFDANGALVWAKAFSGGGVEFVADIAVIGSRTLVSGLFMGTIDFGATSLDTQPLVNDGFLALFDEAGNDVWSRDVGDNGTDATSGIAVDGNTALVTGRCELQVTPTSGEPIACVEGDPFLIRVDEQGGYQAATDALYGPGDAKALGVAVSPGGHPVLVGDFSAQITFGDQTLVSRGQTDMFVARFARK